MADYSKYNSISQQDYETIAGSDWPSYDVFCKHQSVPEHVYKEIDSMCGDHKPFVHNGFCVLPFYGLEILINHKGKTTPCCIMDFDADVDEVRQYMLENKRHPACNHCWTLEDRGIQSDRQLKNISLDYSFNKDIGKIYEDCVQCLNYVNHYKIDSSNLCNATCVTCGEVASSSWAMLKYRNRIIDIKPEITNIATEGIIDYATARSIDLRGGESLLCDENFHILEKLVAHNNTECNISFTTNGSVIPTREQQQLLANFKHVNFCFSVDAIGKRFEYLRFPLKWNRILETMSFCHEQGYSMGISYTVSNLNILYHHETTQWFKEQNIPYLTNPVYSPSYFRIGALPEYAKQRILDQYPDSEMKSWLASHTEQDNVDYQKFLAEIQRQDTWKGISIADYLPEFLEVTKG